MPLDTYLPDLASLDDGFPDALPVPRLLREFARWVGTQPRSSLGWFHLASERLDAAYVHDDHAAEQLREWLGVFMILPQGSRLALWRQASRADQPPAVVLLRASGEVENVAQDLESFLFALARERTGVSELDRGQADGGLARAKLADWLLAQGASERATGAHTPEFASWWQAQLRAALAEPDPRGSRRSTPLPAAELPRDLFERADPLLGLSVEDERLRSFFESFGVDLRAIRDPRALRSIARPEDGVTFEIAWPWDYASQWLASEYPKPARRALERQRARMFWGFTLFVRPERVTRAGETLDFRAYRGALPFDITPEATPAELEAQLGPPTHGNLAGYTWDDATKRRALHAVWNDGRALRPELPRGALCALRWRYSLASEV